jgi:hypothetical protein
VTIASTNIKEYTTRVNTEKEKRFVVNQIKKYISDLDFLIKIKDKESFCKLFAESAFTVEFISNDNNPRNKEISLGTFVKPDKCYLCEFATEVSEDGAESDFIISEGREVPFGVSVIYLLENYSGKFYFAKAFRKYPIFETLKENIKEKFASDFGTLNLGNTMTENTDAQKRAVKEKADKIFEKVDRDSDSLTTIIFDLSHRLEKASDKELKECENLYNATLKGLVSGLKIMDEHKFITCSNSKEWRMTLFNKIKIDIIRKEITRRSCK